MALKSRIKSIWYNFWGFNEVTLKGTNNTVNYKLSFLNKCSFYVSGSNNIINIEKGCRLTNCSIYISGSNNVINIGSNNNFIKADLYIEDNGNSITFGNNNNIHGLTHIAVIEGKSVKIGNDCLSSADITFRVGDSHSILDLNTNTRINESKSITIGNKVWIGNDVKILKGVTLLNDTIVGTGSIVSESPNVANIALAGIPARIVKENIKWKNERI